MDLLVGFLQELGAKGMRDRAPHAFGLHFNTKIPRADAKTVAAHLKAFALLSGYSRR